MPDGPPTRQYVVTIGEATEGEPAVFRSYDATAEQVEDIVAMVGDGYLWTKLAGHDGLVELEAFADERMVEL